MSSKNLSFYNKLEGREELWLELSIDTEGQIVSSSLKGVGHRGFLRQLDDWRGRINGPLQQLKVPDGQDTASMMIRELLLRAKDQWNPPYIDEMMCFCRAITTKAVDDAILIGAHTPQKVSRLTSASTACGTCQPDVEALIEYRLHGSSNTKFEAA